jgi:hypothetical protein
LSVAIAEGNVNMRTFSVAVPLNGATVRGWKLKRHDIGLQAGRRWILKICSEYVRSEGVTEQQKRETTGCVSVALSFLSFCFLLFLKIHYICCCETTGKQLDGRRT